jgi:hypothetical protein
MQKYHCNDDTPCGNLGNQGLHRRNQCNPCHIICTEQTYSAPVHRILASFTSSTETKQAGNVAASNISASSHPSHPSHPSHKTTNHHNQESTMAGRCPASGKKQQALLDSTSLGLECRLLWAAP